MSYDLGIFILIVLLILVKRQRMLCVENCLILIMGKNGNPSTSDSKSDNGYVFDWLAVNVNNCVIYLLNEQLSFRRIIKMVIL